jgi:enterochelin esterase-like enzyme
MRAKHWLSFAIVGTFVIAFGLWGYATIHNIAPVQANRSGQASGLAPTNLNVNFFQQPTATPLSTGTTVSAGQVPVIISNGQTTPSAQTTLPISAPPVNAKAFAWGGRGLVQDVYFYSTILGREMSYRIYLPPNYQKASDRYPTLYMLHGLSGSYQEWVDYGLLNTADDNIAVGKLKPMIMVLPLGDQSYWFNWANNGDRWADYVAQEVVGHVDFHFRTLANAQNRAIGGHSMGGHGALQIGFNNPQTFGIIGAHSATLRTIEQAADFTKEKAYNFWGSAEYYATIDPISLAGNRDLTGLKLYLDIGAEDGGWRPCMEELHNVLLQRGVAHEWHTFPGSHQGEYWIGHVKDYLTFYNSVFTYTAALPAQR